MYIDSLELERSLFPFMVPTHSCGRTLGKEKDMTFCLGNVNISACVSSKIQLRLSKFLPDWFNAKRTVLAPCTVVFEMTGLYRVSS